jgi:hypothetical protein
VLKLRGGRRGGSCLMVSLFVYYFLYSLECVFLQSQPMILKIRSSRLAGK